MRPPRPWPSWRRAMSPLIASAVSSSPAGRPSTMQVRPGPCDSPAVMRRSSTAPSLFAGVRGSARDGAAGVLRGLLRLRLGREDEDARLAGVAQERERDQVGLAEQFLAHA